MECARLFISLYFSFFFSIQDGTHGPRLEPFFAFLFPVYIPFDRALLLGVAVLCPVLPSGSSFFLYLLFLLLNVTGDFAYFFFRYLDFSLVTPVVIPLLTLSPFEIFSR